LGLRLRPRLNSFPARVGLLTTLMVAVAFALPSWADAPASASVSESPVLHVAQAAAPAPAADADAATSAEAGKELYGSVGCSSCHGVDGEGVVAPRLIGSRTVSNVNTLIQRILYGGGDMPPFDSLADEEIAAIANYVRTVINKQTKLVTAEEVAASR